MNKLNYLLLFFASFTFGLANSQAQTVTLSGDDKGNTSSIEGEYLNGIHAVSKSIYKAIEEWQSVGPSQSIPLDKYLESKSELNQDKVALMLETHRENLQSQSDNALRGGSFGQNDCNCTVVTLNSSHEVTPNPAQSSTNNAHEDFSFGRFWDRQFYKWRYGPAHRQYLKVKGKHKATTFESSTSGSANSSNSYAFLHFNYLCTNGALYPTDCGCEKAMNVEARYFSRLKVENHTGGPYSRASFAQAEDHVVFFTYYKDFTTANPSNQIANPVVEEATKALLARRQDATWNPQFWIELFELAATVFDVVTAEEGSFTGTTISEIGNQLVTTLTTSFFTSINGSSDGGAQNDMSLAYSGVVHLYPNNTTTLAMISNGYVYGRGYGGNWHAKAESSSSYLISAIIPFDGSEPECCVEKSAKWVSGQAAYAPVSQASLLNAIGSHLSLFGDWNGLADNNADGNVDVSNNIGFADAAAQCNVCGMTPPIGLTSNSLSPTVRALSWTPLLGTQYYIIEVYKHSSNGNSTLIQTLYSVSPSTTVQYNPNSSYHFRVRAKCVKAGYSDWSDNKHFGAHILVVTKKNALENTEVKQESIQDFAIYPNPVSDELTVDLSIANSVKLISIVDITGRTLAQTTPNGEFLVKIETSNLPTGVYMILVEDGHGQRSSKKFLKN